MVPPHRRHNAIRNRIPGLARRPKRPLTGYNLFIQENKRHVNPLADNAIQVLSARWRGLSQEAKDVYNARVIDDKDRHANQMYEWRRQRGALRRPPTAFGIFLRECWQRWPNHGYSIQGMNNHASNLWHQMTHMERQRYIIIYRNMCIRHRQIVREVRRGGGIPHNWKEEMFPAPVQPDPAPNQP